MPHEGHGIHTPTDAARQESTKLRVLDACQLSKCGAFAQSLRRELYGEIQVAKLQCAEDTRDAVLTGHHSMPAWMYIQALQINHTLTTKASDASCGVFARPSINK